MDIWMLERWFELTPLIDLAGLALSLIGTDGRSASANASRATLLAASLALASFIAGVAHHSLLGAAADLVGETVMLLVAVLGWVITLFSTRYLDGDPGQRRYMASLLLTLAAVSTVVTAQNLGLLVLGWAASSLCLHRLLVFYPERAAARIAAHKKFISSRVSETCLVVAVIVIWQQCGTLTPHEIAARIEAAGGLSSSLQLAFALIAVAVILKSAQLPVHGWLIQVMEAPTPVSALLHAGIVNLGGFVLIRLAEPLAHASVARGLLVFFGASTALLAGLVMMTRISIKVRLAWSTCAQMGFMLMECGLGLYDLALLHLVAHSIYKAHAFLSAGDAVAEARYRKLLTHTGPSPRSSLPSLLLAAPLCGVLLLGSLRLWQVALPDLAINPATLFIVGLGLSPLLWPTGAASAAAALKALARAAALAQLYIGWHWGFASIAPASQPAAMASSLWAAGCLAALYLVQAWLQLHPTGRFARRLYPWVYGGFFLDERFTRLTFRLWPAPRAIGAAPLFSPIPAVTATGERS